MFVINSITRTNEKYIKGRRLQFSGRITYLTAHIFGIDCLTYCVDIANKMNLSYIKVYIKNM